VPRTPGASIAAQTTAAVFRVPDRARRGRPWHLACCASDTARPRSRADFPDPTREENDMLTMRRVTRVLAALCVAAATSGVAQAAPRRGRFALEEATIAEIQKAILAGRITVTELVTLYLERIKAYNGTCVHEPEGILGPISTIPHAGKLNALMTLNLRPATRIAWGFDERKARSMTDAADDDPTMPDAYETAAAIDARFATTKKLVGPLHGVVMAIKDQYDTFDMRTTAGADAFWANDRPPDDATFVQRLRDAGAIILAKANMGEYAAGGITGTRSTFGGTMCNAYDTERDPGASSGGSGMAVAANFVTCAIGEETGTSVREPAKNNNTVGIAPTRELVSADGMVQQGITTRVGPICRTVEDTARILDAYAGFDPADELTAFAVNRKPPKPYWKYAARGADRKHLKGKRIGVVREYMNKSLFTVADAETIDIVDRAIEDLKRLGATVIDPGPTGALFQGCVDEYSPLWRNRLFIGQFPAVFPLDAAGAPATDHIQTLLDMFFDPSLVPHTSAGVPSIRNLGASPGDTGDGRYNFNMYIQERGDAEIRNLGELIVKQKYWSDPAMPSRELDDDDRTLGTGSTLQTRFTLQLVVFQCFAELDLDAVVYPTGNIPPAILTAPQEPSRNDRSSGLWTYINSRGFPAMTVPAGFTTHVYDRDPSGQLVGPIAAALPVGIDFLGLPFSEATLFEIGAAYEAATKHRVPPPDFGPISPQGQPVVRALARTARPMPKPRVFTADELRAIEEN
jgi:Asp-tRNA(Asn)/Glu-tRNA(Gln) amidotransferase A subunit family amidase